MKRPILVIVTLLVLVNATAVVLAAPSAQGPKPVITQPEPDAAVRGVVQIVGSATHPQFQRYELYYAPFPPSDNAWIFIGDAHFQQQPAGLLGTWATAGLPDGAYALRVRVVRQDGNYTDSDPRRVLVVNRRPIESPTPVVTRAQPTAPATPLPPTATIVVAAPTVQLPRAAITPTAPAKIAPTPIIGEARPTATPASSLVDVGRLVDTAQMAAIYTVGLFVAVGAFFTVKAVLAWLWHKIRP